jgi:DNA-binding NarL/FixJ family response regulator
VSGTHQKIAVLERAVGTRILIADDDVAIRRLLRRILEERSGWEVCGEAENGSDAVAKTAELAPDVVILDLAMPEKNGLQAAREIAAVSPWLPMLLLTVQESSPELTSEAWKAGFRAIISKEKGTEVIQGIESLLQGNHAPAP